MCQAPASAGMNGPAFVSQPPARHAACGHPAPSARGSRRRRLWELDSKCHCPVVGVCLSIAALRKIVGRLFREQEADDYAVHVGAVGHCTSRTGLAELLQQALDKRHALVIQRFRQARSPEAVYQLWRSAVAEGCVGGALWAGLTHPACTAQLEDLICREIHMIQHQAGAQERLDRGAFAELQKEHAVLARELGRAQERITQLLADKVRELRALEAQLMQTRAQLIRRESVIAFQRDDLEALRAGLPELASRERLQLRNAELVRLLQLRDQRIVDLQRQVRQAGAGAGQVQAASPGSNVAPRDTAGMGRGEGSEPASAEAADLPKASDAPTLANQTILCVGGRDGSLSRYRAIVEQGGGRFAHHDGGTEQRADALDANLAAADLVICQTGCISHHAYWRVKDYCKRTGKRCVFLDNPSATSFTRGLRQIMLQQVPADTARQEA